MTTFTFGVAVGAAAVSAAVVAALLIEVFHMKREEWACKKIEADCKLRQLILDEDIAMTKEVERGWHV